MSVDQGGKANETSLSVANMLTGTCRVAHFCFLAHEIYGKNVMKDIQVYTESAVLKQDSEILPRQIPQTLEANNA